jgi:4-amino-4-deoxy-L-arabinose transferase-like glycosyltransferase
MRHHAGDLSFVGPGTEALAQRVHRVIAPARATYRYAVAVALLVLVFVALRVWLATTPILSETYYDEAVTGLMALDILRGTQQYFYWGEPYGGAGGDAYIAAAGFGVFGPSTLVLRLTGVAVMALWVAAAASLARQVAGNGAGLMAGLLIALPPVFLSYVQLSSEGEGVAMTCGVLALAAAARLVEPDGAARARTAAWALLGLAAGLGWWASQMTAMSLAAAALAVFVARPRRLREAGPYGALALFLAASLPFWVWNWRHEWQTFRHFATWGASLPDWPTRAQVVLHTLLASLQDSYWDGRAVPLPTAVRLGGGVLVAAVYGLAIGLAAARVGTWVRRLWRRERPWREPLDVVVLAWWLTVAAHLVTSFGAAGVLRYAITFQATLPVLAAVVLARVWRRGGPGRVVAGLLAAGLLGYHAFLHASFVAEAAGLPRRPVDAAIARLDRLGIRACYADSRISQVITFESAERITCADYYGLRNFALLQAVDAVGDPAAVAIVTHWALQSPSPEVLAGTLALMGAEARQDRVGDYVIFHHFRPLDPPVRPIAAAGWAARASTDSDHAGLAFDRKVWTRWSATKEGREWFELDLGAVYRLTRLTLETGPFPPYDAPAGLRVETSPDGRVWDTAAQAAGLLFGVHWWNGHPRVEESGRVLVRFVPRPARYVRLVQTGRDRFLWSIGELFAYEAAGVPWEPPPAARVAHGTAGARLAHWMDEPSGPHPKRTPVSYPHRRAQVRWPAVFDATAEALAVAPEWEEAHHLYARVLALWRWSGDFDQALAQARADGAWGEVLRWATEAASADPDFWRSGRTEARAEALARLGRDADAAAARAAAARVEAERRPARAVRARFGEALELTGVELPATVRRGEPLVVRYAWRALRRSAVDYAAFVRLQGPGRLLFDDHLLGGSYGTSWWDDAERAVETRRLVLPADAPPGTYRLKVGVWRPETGSRLRLTATDLPDRDRHAAVVGTITVE